jgi:dUTPase-like protein
VTTPHIVNVTIDPAFTRLYARQTEFQRAYHDGRDPADFPYAERSEYLRTHALGLIVEVTEAMNETHWKSWTTPPVGDMVINRERYLGEMADVFIFAMNMLIVGDVSMMELAQAVDAKITKNIKRQADGYDGQSSKCPICKRAYDDAGVECRPARPRHPEFKMQVPWCADAGRFIDDSCNS